MLKTRLNSTPYSKLTLIKDSVEYRGYPIIEYVMNSHLKTKDKISYFNFEYNSKVSEFPKSQVQVFDFAGDLCGWIDNSRKSFISTLLAEEKNGCIIIIDSLAHAVLQYGFTAVFKALQKLSSRNNGIMRIIMLLHQDLCEHNVQLSQYFEHLSTFVINIERSNNPRNVKIVHKYKKYSGKILQEIEEYRFENNNLELQTKDLEQSIEDRLHPTVPENLTTFKISLDDKEKESRSKLILPYLPRAENNDNNEESKIFYKFDQGDDWDEEDPDDDLDL